MDETTVTQREFSRRIGKQLSWVQNRIKDGLIPLGKDGKILLAPALEFVSGMLGDGLEQQRARLKAQGVSAKRIKQAEASASADGGDDIAMRYEIAKMKEKEAVAALRRVELEEKEKNLVSVDAVKADAQKVASLVRERLLTLPVRYAGLLEMRPQREIEAVLEKAVDEVLSEFSKSEFASQANEPTTRA